MNFLLIVVLIYAMKKKKDGNVKIGIFGLTNCYIVEYSLSIDTISSKYQFFKLGI